MTWEERWHGAAGRKIGMKRFYPIAVIWGLGFEKGIFNR
jgi:hypothetical protein